MVSIICNPTKNVMSLKSIWRPMNKQDLDTFVHLTYEIWPNHWESPKSLIARYHLYPNGFQIYEIDNMPSGYLMSHPGYLNCPPELNETYALDKGKPTCYHIHDAAIVKTARGNNAIKQVWPYILELATAYNIISLIAVDNTESFWSKLGFIPSNFQANYGTHMILKLNKNK